MDSPLLWIGTVACAGLAAAALVSREGRQRYALLAAALILAPALVVGDNWDSERVADLRDRPLLLAVGLIAAAVALLALGLLARRRPVFLAPALIAALPFRIPVDLGGGSANLLLPLYVLIAAGVVAGLLGGGLRSAGTDARAPGDQGLLRFAGPALGIVLVLYALGAGYADDVSPAVEDIGFFLVPFAALFVLLSATPLDGQLLRAALWVLAVVGLVLAVVAGYQYASGDLFWNDKVIAGNEAHPYFRVNSLFWDPNILGRYLAVTMTALAALVAYGRRRWELIGATALFTVLLATLVVTFSQSSTIALLAGILVLAATRWGIVCGVVAGALTVLALAASLALIGGGGLSSESSGRSGLIDGGLHIAADAPLIGVGSGGFADEFRDRFGGAEGFAVESHTEPVTVLAEQGAVGFIAYLGLLFVSIGGLILATGPRLRERARGTPVAAGLLAIYAVMLVHSLGYAAFLSDPITWAVLALAAATLAPLPVREPSAERTEPARRAA